MSLPTYNFTGRVGDYFQGNFNAGTVSNVVTFGVLPEGIQIGYNSGYNLTGRISGAYGSFSARVLRTYTSGFSEESLLNFEIAPGAPLLVANPALSHKFGSDFSKTFALENPAGRPVTSWQIDGLPSWATYDSATGQITGTPTEVADSEVTITVESPEGSDTKTGTLSIVVGYPLLVPDQIISCKVGEPLSVRPELLDEEYRPANYWWSLQAGFGIPIPAGLSLNSATGFLTGTPTKKAALFAAYLYIRGPGGTIDSTPTQLIRFEVAAGVPIILAGQTATGAVGVAFNKTFALSDAANRPATSWSATGLPAGLVIDAVTGAVTGTPEAVVTTLITLTATGPGGVTSETATIAITGGKPIIVEGQAFTGKVGEYFSAQILLEDAENRPATSWVISGNNSGLTISNSGVISGTPASIVNRSYGLTARSPAGYGAANFQLTITEGTPEIPSPQYFTAYVGDSFEFTPQTNNPGNRPVTSWASTGLPEWATLDEATGTISGTPTEATVSQIVLTGTGPGGEAEAIIEFQSSLLPSIPEGQKFYILRDTPFQAQPDVLNKSLTQDYIYSAQGLPEWATIDSATGIISGLATTPANIVFTYKITDPANNEQSAEIQISVLASAPTITEDQNFTARTGYPISYQSTVADPLAPASTWSAIGLPEGLEINESTGLISGTPTVPGAYTIPLSASNDAGTALTTTLEITIKHWNLMKIYIDPQKRRFLSKADARYPLTKLEFKRRDKMPFELYFIEDKVAVDLPSTTEITVGIKARYEDETYLALVPNGTSILDLNTDEIEAEFVDNPDLINVLLEVRWADDYASTRSVTMPVELGNSVIRDERGGH